MQATSSTTSKVSPHSRVSGFTPPPIQKPNIQLLIFCFHTLHQPWRWWFETKNPSGLETVQDQLSLVNSLPKQCAPKGKGDYHNKRHHVRLLFRAAWAHVRAGSLWADL